MHIVNFEIEKIKQTVFHSLQGDAEMLISEVCNDLVKDPALRKRHLRRALDLISTADVFYWHFAHEECSDLDAVKFCRASLKMLDADFPDFKATSKYPLHQLDALENLFLAAGARHANENRDGLKALLSQDSSAPVTA